MDHSGANLLYTCTCANPENVKTSKMEFFVKIANGFQSLTCFTESSILDVWLGSLPIWLLLRREAKDIFENNYFCFNTILTFPVMYYSQLITWWNVCRKSLFLCLRYRFLGENASF